MRAVMFETRTVQACGKNALHMRHAPAGGAGPSRRLSDLRDEARAHTEATIDGCREEGERRR